MGLAVPLSVELRDVTHTAVPPERQSVTLCHARKAGRARSSSVDVVVRVDVRRQLPGQLGEALELSFDLGLRRVGRRRDHHVQADAEVGMVAR